MGFKELLKRIFLWDLWKGLALTFSYQRPSATYTEQYPLERPPVAERYRGAPRLNNHPETGETLCIACNLCSLACPENLIVVGWERTEDRRKKLTTFTYDLVGRLRSVTDPGAVSATHFVAAGEAVPQFGAAVPSDP